jgi:hypothetical protein
MDHNLYLAPNDIATKVMEMAFSNLATWPMKSAETFRNAVLGDGAFAINPLMNVEENIDVSFLHSTIRDTVAEGCMIDFGFIPNQVLKEESTRSRDMFESGELQMPFERWLGITRWEGGFNGYMIITDPKDHRNVLVFELYGVSIPDTCDVVLVYDVISLGILGLGNTVVMPIDMLAKEMNSKEHLEKRGANTLDPLVTMLRLLADASVPVEYRQAPERLNKHRVKQGKHPIPAYTVVDSRDYVTNFSHHGKPVKGNRNGTHASPIAHWRKAHKRVLADGRIIPVKSSKVNWRSSEELHRMFYKTK